MKPAFQRYACKYQLDGETWNLVVLAETPEEAVRRMRAIGANGQLLGEVVALLPGYPGMRKIAAAIVMVRNSLAVVFGRGMS